MYTLNIYIYIYSPHTKITWIWPLILKLALNEDPPQSNIYIYGWNQDNMAIIISIIRSKDSKNNYYYEWKCGNPQIIKFEYFALIISFYIFAQIKHFSPNE